MPRGQDTGSSGGQVHESAEPSQGDVFVNRNVMDVGAVKTGSLVSLHLTSRRIRAVLLYRCCGGGSTDERPLGRIGRYVRAYPSLVGATP
jgi:hypothetical protein